ncbi:MAG: LysR family transcriptional regulator [Deltaproteobacteria bacterium]|nr:LysR family transcriptional regulator [Deltaproteobacteria bacterium]
MSGEKSEGLESFVAIVEHGSIAAGARALGTPRETLSRRLLRLEDRLGVRLLHRTTRDASMTPEGKALYAHARRMVNATEEAIRSVRLLDDVPRGVLRVSAPAGDLLGPVFESFLRTWPEVELEVLCTSRYIDVVAEGVHVALRGGEPRGDGLIARRLWHSEIVAVASSAYVERNGLPQGLRELTEHDCLLSLIDGQPIRQWPTHNGETAAVNGRMVTNDLSLRMALVRRGAGIGQTLRPFVQDELARGDLVVVLPGLLGCPTGMNVIFVEKEKMQPKVRAFIDHVVQWFDDHGLKALLHTHR